MNLIGNVFLEEEKKMFIFRTGFFLFQDQFYNICASRFTHSYSEIEIQLLTVPSSYQVICRQKIVRFLVEYSPKTKKKNIRY